jgi:biotin transport system substrate-specific component
MTRAGFVALGAIAVAVAAWIEVPMVPVPMTMQTYAVLVTGALLGWRLGVAAMIVYLAAAAIGLPVLSGGSSGLDRLIGATAGYLAGFVVAAAMVGWLGERGWARAGVARCVAAMALGHAVVLGLGVTWLAARIGWSQALAAGLTPFIPGAIVKSVLAAATVMAIAKRPPAAQR